MNERPIGIKSHYTNFRNIDNNNNMTGKTGNHYIPGTMTDIVEIPTAHLGHSTLVSSTKSDCDNDGQPK